MQLILYSKNSQFPQTPSVISWDPKSDGTGMKEFANPGVICIASLLCLDSLTSHIADSGFCDCGTKGGKIDLRRALGFNQKKNRDLPKQIFFGTSSIGAFKRGLQAFYDNHFTSTDPACLVVVSDSLFESLLHDIGRSVNRTAPAVPIDETDPLFKLININPEEPIIRKLEDIYLGNSMAVKHTRALIFKASQTDSPVLILGESGTGKDIIATQIFQNSKVYNSGFFRINCSALPEELLESELFGHMKGVFTGAVNETTGLFEAASGGTIFLDEIGDLTPANQVRILHAVENKEIRKVGSTKMIKVNVRIIAATNRNLDSMMQQGTFRDDLYYRISTFRITAPPLREHPEDIPLIVSNYWMRKGWKGKLSFEFLEYLKEYHWPGNVRELYSLLNSIVDYFTDISPTPAHVDAIRKSRQEALLHSRITGNDDPAQFMKIKSHELLISLQNTLRLIKIAMRPVINKQMNVKNLRSELAGLKAFLQRQIEILNGYLLEPSYYKRWELFKSATRYRYLLEKMVSNWPASAEVLRTAWMAELQQLDDEINKGIMEILWGKIDM